MGPINCTVIVERVVTMTRPEEGTFKLVITPTPAFMALPPEEQEAAVIAINKTRFSYTRDGSIAIWDTGLDELFTVDVAAEQWDYAGGECHTLDTHYEHWARRQS